MYNIVIASGTTAILIIPMASTVSINFGKNIGINFGTTKTPKIGPKNAVMLSKKNIEVD